MLKTYMITKDAEDTHCGVLNYDTDTDYYSLDINPDYPIEDLPAILAAYRSIGKTSLDHNETLRFIRARVIPAERHNIDKILWEIDEDVYSELAMLEYTQGRCCMDEFYLLQGR